MELTLLEEGISLRDQKELGSKKRLYYEFIIAKRRIQHKKMKEKMDESTSNSGGHKTLHGEAPTSFMNELESKIAERELEVRKNE